MQWSLELRTGAGEARLLQPPSAAPMPRSCFCLCLPLFFLDVGRPLPQTGGRPPHGEEMVLCCCIHLLTVFPSQTTMQRKEKILRNKKRPRFSDLPVLTHLHAHGSKWLWYPGLGPVPPPGPVGTVTPASLGANTNSKLLRRSRASKEAGRDCP